MKYLLSLFRRHTPLELATKELVQAQIGKLEADTAAEYAEAIGLYNQSRIERLKAYINELTKETA